MFESFGLEPKCVYWIIFASVANGIRLFNNIILNIFDKVGSKLIERYEVTFSVLELILCQRIFRQGRNKITRHCVVNIEM